jgi:hypothetical protein
MAVKDKHKPRPRDASGKLTGGTLPFEPTDEQREKVKELATAGIAQPQICLMIKHRDGKPISKSTLHEYFAEELETGTIEANAAVAGMLYNQAISGNIAAQIFWLKTRARWRETPHQVAFTDPDGNAVKPPTLSDMYKIMAGEVEPPVQANEGS